MDKAAKAELTYDRNEERQKKLRDEESKEMQPAYTKTVPMIIRTRLKDTSFVITSTALLSSYR